MQSSLPTLSLQRFYLSSTLQTPRQALRGQESTLPSRTWRLEQRQQQAGRLGARPPSPVGAGLHLRAPETCGRPRAGGPDPAPQHAASLRPRPPRTHLSRPRSGHTPGGPERAAPPRRSSAQAAQVGAKLHARPASCMTQAAGRRRAAGSARSRHHPAERTPTDRSRDSTVTCPAAPQANALLRRPGAPGRRGSDGGPLGGWRWVRLVLDSARLHQLGVEKGKPSGAWSLPMEVGARTKQSGKTFVGMDEQGFGFLFLLSLPNLQRF